MNAHVDGLDDRRIEVVANGGGACSLRLIDTTLVSALDSAGHTRVYQRRAEGAALRLARRAKERTYREILSSHRCRLVVVGLEVGGRWSAEAAQFVSLPRARSVPDDMQASCAAAYRGRWSALISFAAVRAYLPAQPSRARAGCQRRPC